MDTNRLINGLISHNDQGDELMMDVFRKFSTFHGGCKFVIDLTNLLHEGTGADDTFTKIASYLALLKLAEISQRLAVEKAGK